jgi:hypothetical protein
MSELATGGQIKSGDWYAHCDVCARRFFGSTLRKQWNNAIVCDDCYEDRHPQDFLKTVTDKRTPPFIRPDPVERGTVVSYDPTTQNWYDVSE